MGSAWCSQRHVSHTRVHTGTETNLPTHTRTPPGRRKLGPEETAKMIKVAAMPPVERHEKIVQLLLRKLKVCVCVCVAVCLCGCVAVWLCVCVAVCLTACVRARASAGGDQA